MEPLYRQVIRSIREAIAGGELKPGDRIPSVTDLAGTLSVNRATIVQAFQELERAGLITSHVGRGTFVCESAPPQAVQTADRAPRRVRDGFVPGLRELLAIERPVGTLNLSSGVPDPATIPPGTLDRLSRQALAHNPERLIEYGTPGGLPELREAIAARMGVHRDQVLVTNGSQQAASLLASWALEAGRGILCETPTFTGIPGAFIVQGHSVESVRWEGEALDLARAPRTRSLLYACPDHHNPTGRCMSLAGRQELAAFAGQADCVVVVDEIFRDLRFRGEPLPSLYPLLPPGRRVCVGSVSKTFMTGLRVGYIVADAPLVAELLPIKRYLDLGGPALTQAIAAAFLREGYDAHVERVRGIYRERADAAVEALERALPSGVSFTRPEGGFHLWVTLPAGASAIQLYLRALERGVAVSPGPAHDIDGRFTNCFRVSTSHASPAELRDAIGRLAAIIRQSPLVDASAGLGVSL